MSLAGLNPAGTGLAGASAVAMNTVGTGAAASTPAATHPAASSEPAFLSKIHPRAAAAAACAVLPKPVVFTNGVFDVLHRGHASYLAAARALGGSLVVALNTDASAKRLGKGPGRPLNNEADRAALIAALESVRMVTWFDEDTPLEIIDALRPEIIVKGGDYDMQLLKEAQLVQSYGGQALALSFVDGYSTTALVQKIRAG